ncbi:hypothetical protein Pan44_42260 [Caulifigura coniformis]|uniref:DUF2071 domain-containing protein n=1 Tax=Caulifigura coniformis TaxID=2527983 RepID=A0A517SJ71_9PLAN|nr:DUF2071 domain-containing protein [Caulifigura coniformis]QDT56174.1 hypothetical protein Pan44_42260 [Caulifigura coniformis]
MRIPTITGLIRRRLLLNFRVDPQIIEKLLPRPLRPKIHNGHAIAGLCLIRLEQIRPTGVPALFGLASENGAHRIAVTWNNTDGRCLNGVYIPRRDTGSMFTWLAGGRLFPGEHSFGTFQVRDDGRNVQLDYQARDGLEIHVSGSDSSHWPDDSCFASAAESSRFFQTGSLGFSRTGDCCRLDGLELVTTDWRVEPFSVGRVQATWFDDRSKFPAGSAEFDHALVMRNISHEWRSTESMRVEPIGLDQLASAVR